MTSSKRVVVSLTTLSVLGLLIFGLLNLQAVADWWRFRGYAPPAEISAIAQADTMTAEGRRIFYVTHPVLVKDAATFRRSCPSFEQTIVLGCYQSGVSSTVFIYKVSDERLNGVVEVTGAHEMLHAAYDRLEKKEKDRISGLLNAFYTGHLSDKRVVETIEAYKQTEPEELINEMHSIFATEINNLTPELESYYSRYFTNRSAVVSFANQYADEFSSRIAMIKEYQQQLTSLKQQINTLEADLSRRQAKIESDRRRLDALRSSGQTNEYNAAVDEFNAEINGYNADVTRLKNLISEYNNLVAAHNALASELSSLYESLDTSISTQTQQ